MTQEPARASLNVPWFPRRPGFGAFAVAMLAGGLGLAGCGGSAREPLAGIAGAPGVANGTGGASIKGGTGGTSAAGDSDGGAATGGAGAVPGAATGGGGVVPGDAGAADRAGGDGSSPDGIGIACQTPGIPAGTFRRLTPLEYNNTVRDLFADLSRPADALPYEAAGDGEQIPATAAHVDGYHTLAHAFALKVTKDSATVRMFTGCDDAAQGEAACRRLFIDDVISRVFRRAANAADAADLDAVFTEGVRLGGGYAGGVRAVVEVALQAPEFLYRIEFGEAAPGKPAAWARPTPHEMAARLSYLLWGSTPDAALRDAANKGALRTTKEIETQARRMLLDPRAHEMVRAFYFHLLPMDSSVAGTSGRANITADIGALMKQETEAFIEDVTWQAPGDLRALLTAPYTWVNAPLAAFYGIAGITGQTFQRTAVNKSQRGGLLTQGSFLTVNSLPGASRPVRRGRLIVDQFLCDPAIPPPPGVEFAPDPLPPMTTTRQRYEIHSTEPSCIACHKFFDPIGFAFEHYDEKGLWRDMEQGLPIDATGEIIRTDAAGKFDGAIALAERLAGSQDVKNCYVGKWMTYAYGRKDTENDACSRQTLQQAFAKASYNIPELLVALTQTDAFLYRPASEVKP